MKSPLICLLILIAQNTLSQQTKTYVVHFDFDKYALSTGAKTLLDSLDLEKVSIALEGHCDAKGAQEYNMALSRLRINAVKQYLLNTGINEENFHAEYPYGETKPLNGNSTEAERKENRRVIIHITMMNQKEEQVDELKSTTVNDDIKEEGTPTLDKMFSDSAIQEGSKVILKNIHFVGGYSWITRSSQPLLSELLNIMKTRPTLEIEIQGHICCQAGPGDAIDLETKMNNLSEARAKAVYNYLIQNGIDKNRVRYKGFGHSRPIHPYPEKSLQQGEENRRVEIFIIRK